MSLSEILPEPKKVCTESNMESRCSTKTETQHVEHFTCFICMSVLVHPVNLNCCGNFVCMYCAEQYYLSQLMQILDNDEEDEFWTKHLHLSRVIRFEKVLIHNPTSGHVHGNNTNNNNTNINDGSQHMPHSTHPKMTSMDDAKKISESMTVASYVAAWDAFHRLNIKKKVKCPHCRAEWPSDLAVNTVVNDYLKTYFKSHVAENQLQQEQRALQVLASKIYFRSARCHHMMTTVQACLNILSDDAVIRVEDFCNLVARACESDGYAPVDIDEVRFVVRDVFALYKDVLVWCYYKGVIFHMDADVNYISRRLLENIVDSVRITAESIENLPIASRPSPTTTTTTTTPPDSNVIAEFQSRTTPVENEKIDEYRFELELRVLLKHAIQEDSTSLTNNRVLEIFDQPKFKRIIEDRSEFFDKSPSCFLESFISKHTAFALSQQSERRKNRTKIIVTAPPVQSQVCF